MKHGRQGSSRCSSARRWRAARSRCSATGASYGTSPTSRTRSRPSSSRPWSPLRSAGRSTWGRARPSRSSRSRACARRSPAAWRGGDGPVAPRPGEDRHRVDHIDDRLTELTGWAPKVELRRGLEETIEFYLVGTAIATGARWATCPPASPRVHADQERLQLPDGVPVDVAQIAASCGRRTRARCARSRRPPGAWRGSRGRRGCRCAPIRRHSCSPRSAWSRAV